MLPAEKVMVDAKKNSTPLSDALDHLLSDRVTGDAESDTTTSAFFESEFYNPFIQKLNRYRRHGNRLRDEHLSEYSGLEAGVSLILESAIRAQHTIEQELSRVPLQRPSARNSVYYRLAEAKDFIDAHFLQPINLEEIARVACLSHYHFLRLFKSVFETTPYQYVIAKRLQKAAQMLEDTNEMIGDISMIVGFETLPAFSDSFRREFGVSPSQYRDARKTLP